MTAVREWLVSVICAAVAVAVAESMVPEGSMKKLVSMTGGLVLLILLVRPLGDVELDRLELEYQDYAAAIERRTEELKTENMQELIEIIELETAAYISDKARELGLDCRAKVRCRTDEDGVPYPYSVTVDGAASEELRSWMERELNIPAERQVFHGTEG